MDIQMRNTQLCRLCLESESENGSFLVEIFSSLINEPGKMNLSEKIKALFGLKILSNDGLPHWICHKCLVLTENCMEFRDKCVKNDEKLRLIFKVNVEEEAREQEVTPELPQDEEIVEEEDEEVITLNPNNLYESSDESESEHPQEHLLDHQNAPPTSININPPPERVLNASNAANDFSKKEIFHCRYCDVVFSEQLACTVHEQKSHDPTYPYECSLCSYRAEQHATLIFHIKQNHNSDKPFLCTQCSKSFIRRSDLRKHTFVHAGIRLYCCDICSKSFTRNTNLTKHKRTHSEKTKSSYKCTLCPKVFVTKQELSRHVDVHMDIKSMMCKYCNQAFIRRDLLEIHQKSHFDSSSSPVESLVVNPAHAKPIVFYNQPQEQPTPMNFYTENMFMDVINPPSQQLLTPKNEYPIMNQLLSGVNVIPTMTSPVKTAECGICKKTFSKKKELDRHVMDIHTNIQMYKCQSCPKKFNRKDKFRQHEKTHLVQPTIFNCSLCPAVFIKAHMLEMHSKVHEVSNGHKDIKPIVQHPIHDNSESNGFAMQKTENVDDHPKSPNHPISANLDPPAPEQPEICTPMNLSMTKDATEPMDLSNDKTDDVIEIISDEPIPRITIESDDDEVNALHIAEEPSIKKSPSIRDIFHQTPQVSLPTSDLIAEPLFPIAETKFKLEGEEDTKKVEEISFAMTSRIANLDKLEQLRDLPMEILNND